MSQDGRVYRFLEYQLDVDARTLTFKGERIALQDRPFDLLAYLLENRDRVVPRGELSGAVWRGTSVGPEALRFALYSIRRSLDRGDGELQIIETVRGRGVRFAARVTEQPADRSADVSTAPVLLCGRNEFRSASKRVLALTKVREPAVLLVSGEAGIGKTTCLRYMAELALQSGFRVLQGSCAGTESQVSYRAWSELLSNLESTGVSDDSVRRSDLVAVADFWPPPRDREITKLGVGGARVEFFEQVVQKLRRSADQTPIVIILDDLHLADDESISLLEHVAYESIGVGLLVVAAYRTRELNMRPVIASAVGRLDALARSNYVHLAGLEPVDIEEMIRSRCSIEPSRTQTRALHQKTKGNPLFLRELIRVIEHENRLGDLSAERPIEIPLPKYLREAILSSVGNLEADLVEVLRCGAIAGNRFRLSDVASALDMPTTTMSENLTALCHEGLLVREGGVGQLAFSHDLVRDAIYESIPEVTRQAIHERLGIAIEQDPVAASGPRAGELAYHLSAACAPGNVERVADLALLASSWESRRGGYRQAVTHLERAVSLFGICSESHVHSQAEVWAALGDARIWAGEREDAREAFRNAIDLARAGERPEMLSRVALRYAPDFLSIETGVLDGEQIGFLEEALGAVADERERAKLCARLAVALHWSDESERRRQELIALSMQIALRVKDPSLSAYVSIARALALYSVERPRDLTLDVNQPLEHEDPVLRLVARLMRVTSFWLCGEIGRVRTEIEEFSDSAAVVRVPQARWYVWMLKASIAQWEGDREKALALGEKFFREGRLAGDKNAVHTYLLQRFMASVDSGGAESFENGVREIAEAFPRVVGWRSGLLLLLTETERYAEAGELLDQLLAENVLAKPKRNEWFALVGPLAIASARMSNGRWASSIYDSLVPHRDQHAVVGYGSYSWGSVEQLLGLCAAADCEWALAYSHYERAIEVNRHAGGYPAMARVHFDAGEALARAGDRRLAESHWVECERIAKHSKMDRLGERAQARRSARL